MEKWQINWNQEQQSHEESTTALPKTRATNRKSWNLLTNNLTSSVNITLYLFCWPVKVLLHSDHGAQVIVDREERVSPAADVGTVEGWREVLVLRNEQSCSAAANKQQQTENLNTPSYALWKHQWEENMDSNYVHLLK